MAKRTAQGAASAASTEATATGTVPAADAAGAAAAADAAATSSDDAAAPASTGPTFPLSVTIRNHATLAFSEPITGAFLPGGGSATVTLHDAEHAEQVADSLHNIVETNYLAPGALAVDPA